MINIQIITERTHNRPAIKPQAFQKAKEQVNEQLRSEVHGQIWQTSNAIRSNPRGSFGRNESGFGVGKSIRPHRGIRGAFKAVRKVFRASPKTRDALAIAWLTFMPIAVGIFAYKVLS